MRLRISLTADQIDVIEDPARFKCLMAGRRWGKTFAAASALVKCATKNKSKAWYIAPSYAQAIAVWEMIDGNAGVKSVITKSTTQPFPVIRFTNGSVLGFRSFDRPKNLRGSGLDLVWVDEIQDIAADHFWPVIRPLISDRRGCMYISGQFRGHNWYYEQLYLPGLDGRKKQFRSWRFPSSSGLVYQSEEGRAELDLVKETLPRSVYDQEYECVPTANQAAVFRAEDLEAAKQGEYYKAGIDGKSYLVGVDLGRVADPLALVVIDVSNASVVYSEEFPLGRKHELSARRVKEIVDRFNNAAVIADTTGGATGGRAKPDEHIKYYRQLMPNMRAWHWSTGNKDEAVAALSLALEQGKIKIPAENSELHKQLALYEYKVRHNGTVEYTGSQGHDDLVAALYLAWVAYRHKWYTTNDKNSIAGMGYI